MITALTGSNSFLLQQSLQQIVNAYVKEYGDIGLERIAGEDATYEQIQGSLESLPFLTPKKLVILRVPSTNKQFAEKLERLIERIPDSVDVVIVEPKPDKRSVYYKFLKKNTICVEFNELDARELPSWLVGQAKLGEGSVSIADARYLVERIGANQQLLSSEIQKLLDYDPVITRATIDVMTDQTPQSTVFQLVDATFAGNAKRALELYGEQRRQKVEPLAIMGMIAWQLHILALVKTAGDKLLSEVATESKVSPYVLQKSQNIVQNMSLATLKQLIRRVVDLDVRLKTVTIDADEAMAQLFVDIASIAI
jgi:DNA polymerase-3 subunit delta